MYIHYHIETYKAPLNPTRSKCTHGYVSIEAFVNSFSQFTTDMILLQDLFY